MLQKMLNKLKEYFGHEDEKVSANRQIATAISVSVLILIIVSKCFGVTRESHAEEMSTIQVEESAKELPTVDLVTKENIQVKRVGDLFVITGTTTPGATVKLLEGEKTIYSQISTDGNFSFKTKYKDDQNWIYVNASKKGMSERQIHINVVRELTVEEKKKIEEDIKKTEEERKERVEEEHRQNIKLTIENVFDEYVKKDDFVSGINDLSITNGFVVARLKMKNFGSLNENSRGICLGITREISENLSKIAEVEDVTFIFEIDWEDKYGNPAPNAFLMKLQFDKKVWKRINWGNVSYKNLGQLATQFQQCVPFQQAAFREYTSSS